jgi:site-specific DNA-methyltransferase (adenine-specific)
MALPNHLSGNKVELYQGDCLSILHNLPSFDAVITDPPYSSGGQSKSARSGSTGAKYLNTVDRDKFPDFLGDTKDQRSFLHWSALWMGLCHERMTPGGVIAVFSDWRQLPVTTDALQAAGFTWRGIAVWDKNGSARPYKGGYRSQAEYIVWGSKGGLVGTEYAPGLFKATHRGEEKLHQVGKPLALMTDLLQIAGEHVVDPFMGSGTTGMAALGLGKRFTGIEMDKHYFEVAARRIAETGALPL